MSENLFNAHRFKLGFWNGNRLPVLLQGESSECGLACLAMVCGFHGHETDLNNLRSKYAISLRGSTLRDLTELGKKLDLSSRALRTELDDLPCLKTPCILHWNMNHFVVLKKAIASPNGTLRRLIIHDPAFGVREISGSDASRSFTGIALELTPNIHFEPKVEKQRVTLRDILGKVKGVHCGVIQIAILALATEILALFAPFFIQLVIDSAIMSADRSLLGLLALGFGLMMLVQHVFGGCRSWLLLQMGTQINIQWLANLFRHLLRLPISYFEKRHLGDVVSRFGAIQVIQQTLTSNFVEAMLDGILAFAVLAVMFFYNVTLSIIVLLSVGFYLFARYCSYGMFRRAAEDRVNLMAKEQSIFLESVRAIQSLKLFNREDQRSSHWLNSLAAATNRDIAIKKMELGFSLTHKVVEGCENIVIVWVGASLVISNQLSVGMLLAFLAYKTTFATRMYSMIDKGLELKMLGLQCERLSDIVLTQPEFTSDLGLTHPVLECRPAIAVEGRHLWFRYSEHEPWVLRDVTFRIEAGESVAIVGPSGCGKTTLLKILLGLLKPSGGEILINGVSLSHIGTERYRSLIGTVMQDDTLLSGSIAENIGFFDHQLDSPWMLQCAERASIAEDIARMPMKYQTLVGDMGTSLSGGQKQRILLARALYKRPRILFLDEATSHLDVAREDDISRMIGKLDVTRIIVAHRSETIRSADRILELVEGAMKEPET